MLTLTPPAPETWRTWYGMVDGSMDGLRIATGESRPWIVRIPRVPSAPLTPGPMPAPAPLLSHGGRPDELVAEILVLVTLVVAWVGIARVRGKGFAWMPKTLGWGLVGSAPVLLVVALLLPTVIMREPTPAANRPSSTATILITAPSEGQRVSTATLDVATRVSGATIVEGSATEATPDTGHVHIYVDDQLMSMAYAPEQEIAIDWLGPGRHVVRVEFVAADHAPFDPPIEASVTFVKLTG